MLTRRPVAYMLHFMAGPTPVRLAVRTKLLALAVALWAPLAVASCGIRTGLFVLEEVPAPADAAPPADAADAAPDVAPDVSADAGVDSFEAPDVSFDALPPIDAFFPPDVQIDNCPDAGGTLIYVLTAENQIFSFYPPTLVFTLVGTVDCPTSATPWSMAVDRTGVAYSVFADGNLFQLDTATAACVPTTFVPGQMGFLTFGMGFVADTNDTGETLFVAEDSFSGGTKQLSAGLGSIDTTSFALRFVGPFNPAAAGPELTGTADGRLFGFYTNAAGSGSHIIEIDKNTGNLLADNALQVGGPDDGYAFAFWGGDFWVFTFSGGPTQITEFDPATQTETPMGTMVEGVVGAGVSTCAPQ